MNGLVLIPVRRDPLITPFLLRPLAGRSPFVRTLDYARTLRASIGRPLGIAVVSDDPAVRQALQGADDIAMPTRTETELGPALAEAMGSWEAATQSRVDVVYVLEPPHPFRPAHLGLEAYDLLSRSPNLDSVVCVEQLHGRLWATDSSLQPHADSLCANFYGDAAPFREVVGLMLLTRRRVIASGRRIGEHVGLLVVDRKWGFCDVRSGESFTIAEALAPLFEDFAAQPAAPSVAEPVLEG